MANDALIDGAPGGVLIQKANAGGDEVIIGQIAFAAFLEDGTGVIAVARLVPEPVTLTFLAAGAGLVILRRRR